MSSSKIFIDPLVGNVGIGLTNPTHKLHVFGNARIQGDLIVNGSQTTVENYTTVSSNVSIVNISGFGPALRVAQSGNGVGYPVADFYDNDVSTTVPSLRIADGGNVGIGTAVPQESLHVQGNIYASGDVTAFSDMRFKQNITKISNALEKVKVINGYTYTMINCETRHAGVLAQEVEMVLPEVVVTHDGVKSVAYGNMVGLLIEAIKEQSLLIDELFRMSRASKVVD